MADFDNDEIMNAYRKTFSPAIGGVVLYDLAVYCNFLSTTTGSPAEEAKRDVFLHILEMYGLDSVFEITEAIRAITNKLRKGQELADN